MFVVGGGGTCAMVWVERDHPYVRRLGCSHCQRPFSFRPLTGVQQPLTQHDRSPVGGGLQRRPIRSYAEYKRNPRWVGASPLPMCFVFLQDQGPSLQPIIVHPPPHASSVTATNPARSVHRRSSPSAMITVPSRVPAAPAPAARSAQPRTWIDADGRNVDDSRGVRTAHTAAPVDESSGTAAFETIADAVGSNHTVRARQKLLLAA